MEDMGSGLGAVPCPHVSQTRRDMGYPIQSFHRHLNY